MRIERQRTSDDSMLGWAVEFLIALGLLKGASDEAGESREPAFEKGSPSHRF